MNTKTASVSIGVIFLLVGLLGYVPSLASNNSIFHTDSVINMVHVISGILLFIFIVTLPERLPIFLKASGLIYLLVGLLGFATIGTEPATEVLGFLNVNHADNYLHIALGILILIVGALPQMKAQGSISGT